MIALDPENRAVQTVSKVASLFAPSPPIPRPFPSIALAKEYRAFQPANVWRTHMASVSLTVNGKTVAADVDPRTLLVDFLRENLRLTGTHVGCDTSQCGACLVHIDGVAVKSCTTFAVQVSGSSVTTIE